MHVLFDSRLNIVGGLKLPVFEFVTIRYDTIEEINVDSKAEYTA